MRLFLMVGILVSGLVWAEQQMPWQVERAKAELAKSGAKKVVVKVGERTYTLERRAK